MIIIYQCISNGQVLLSSQTGVFTFLIFRFSPAFLSDQLNVTANVPNKDESKVLFCSNHLHLFQL